MSRSRNNAEETQDLRKEGIYLVFLIIGMMGMVGLSKALFA